MTSKKTGNEEQHCRRCDKTKPIKNFNTDNRTPNGRKIICNDCINIHRRIIYHAKKNKEAMLESQNNTCIICGITPDKSKKQFVIDHNHKTHVIRGVLCNNCNVGLGYFKDDPGRLAMAIKYLIDTDGTA